MDNQAIKQFYELLRCKICDHPKSFRDGKFSLHNMSTVEE